MKGKEMGWENDQRMRNSPFEVYGVNEERELIPYTMQDTFTLTPHLGKLWLQRACFWVLRKIGCNAIGHELKVTRQRIDPERVARALLDQKHVAQFVFDRPDRITSVAMGPEQYRELMAEDWCTNGAVTFHAETKGGINGRPCMFGLLVTVVPWMDGILVLPESLS